MARMWRRGWPGKVVHRRLAWLAILPALWTVPAGAQLSGGDVREDDALMLTCRGFFEAYPKSGDSKADKPVDDSHKMLVTLTDHPAFRKRNPSQKERNQYIDQGRKIWRLPDRKQFDQQSDKCADLIDTINGAVF